MDADEHLLLTAVERWKILAISGSIWIIRSFYTATFAWRLSTWVFTHLENLSLSTEAQTLAIHCLGAFGSSILGSGRY